MKRVRIYYYALAIITLLIAPAFSNPVASASISSSLTISFTGSVTPSVPNWAEVPDDWDLTGIYNTLPVVIDNTVLHDGHSSIKNVKQGSLSREVLCYDKSRPDKVIPIHTGDHIVFKIWMKTGASTIGDNSVGAGERFGIDFKDASYGRITGTNSPTGAVWTPSGGYPADQDVSYVNWNHDWEQRTIDFIVPPQYVADGIAGGYPAGTMHTPAFMILWTQVWSNTNGNADNGIAWFADAELYINP